MSEQGPAGDDIPRVPDPRTRLQTAVDSIELANLYLVDSLPRATRGRDQVRALLAACQAKDVKIRRVTDNNARLISITTRAREQFEARIHALTTQTDQLEAAHARELSETIDERDSIWRDHEALRQRCAQFDTELQAAQGDLQALRQEISSKDRELADHDARLVASGQENAALRGEVQQLRGALAAGQAALMGLQQELAQARSEVTNLERANQDLMRVLGQRDARIAALDGYCSRLLAWGWQLHLRLRHKIRRERKGIVEEKRSRDRLILTSLIVLLFVLWCWVFDWQAGLFSHLNGVAPGGGVMLWVLLALGFIVLFAKTMKGFAGPVFQPSSFEFVPIPDEPEEQVPPPPAAPAVAVAAPAPGAPAVGGAPAAAPVAVAVAAPPAAPAQVANGNGGEEQPAQFYCGRLRYVLLFVLLLGPVWDMLDMNNRLNPWLQSRGVHTLSTVQVETPAGTNVSRVRVWANGQGGMSVTVYGGRDDGKPLWTNASCRLVDDASERR